MNNLSVIQVYAINRKSRIERKEHILKQFLDKEEFNLNIIEAIENKVGAVGLWYTIKYIISNFSQCKNDFIVLCEDDHQFTEYYSSKRFLASIAEAISKNADILCGGVSWPNAAIQVTENIFWVQKFSGLQFTVIFKKFFNTILHAPFKVGDAADYKISELSQFTFFIHPFISVQKDFGYSDVTIQNQQPGYNSGLFANSQKAIQNLKNVNYFFNKIKEKRWQYVEFKPYENISIPTYVINLAKRIDRKEHIIQQFKNKPEFRITLVEAVENKIGALGLWMSIRKTVELAIKNNESVIIICEDDHEFTERYSKSFLFKNIAEAGMQGADILSGGLIYFFQTLLISQNRFWIDFFYNTQFMVIYKSGFQKILNEPFDENVDFARLLSFANTIKMTIFPFISIQKEFGNSDVGRTFVKDKAMITNSFKDTEERLEIIRRIYNKYSGVEDEDFIVNKPLPELLSSTNKSYFENVFFKSNYYQDPYLKKK